MAKKLTPRIVTADQAQEIIGTSDAPPPRLSRPAPLSKVRTRANFADAIGRLWAEAEENFIAIGRYLNHAKATLDHGEFMEMVGRDLPFHYSTGNRMMKVAAAVDSNALALDTMPGSYAVAYEVLTLTEPERAAAADAGLIRPDVKRAELVAFKRRLRTPYPPPQSDRRAELMARRARILAELEAVDRELAALP